jgi:Bacterial SH3 domain
LSRRISRLRTEPPDRQPVLIVGALALGLVAGLIAMPRLFSGLDSRAESYLVLASTLYQQGESPALLRDRLTSVGIVQPPSAVLATAQRYATSRDKKQQHQAEALEAFGKVLLNPDSAPPLASATPGAPALTPGPAGTPGAGLPTLSTPIGARPTQPGGFAAGVGTPAVGQPGLPPPGTPAPGAAASPAVGPPAPPSSGASAPAGPIQRGRIKPADGGPALLRKEPSRDGGTLSLIPNAAQVEVLETVRGQAVEGETRWLRVRYGNLTGYLWSKLVVVGD